MREEEITADRLAAFSDAVFAVIVTIMVLELKAPEEPELSALSSLRSTAVSYVVSYIFIAIIWINHDYLMRFVGPPTVVPYAGLFVGIDIAYDFFELHAGVRTHAANRAARSLIVLAAFLVAMLVAIVAPRVGFGLICGGLVLHLRPEAAPGSRL
jgi:hypothetical protein